LRDRGEDIEVLAPHFITELNRRYGGPVALDLDSASWLHTQPWPGNIRQLENFLEREYLLSEQQTMLRFRALRDTGPAKQPAVERWNYRSAKARVVESFNRSYLDELMLFANGNVSLAARAAGKERRDLGRLLRKYSIAPGNFRSPNRS
jgi:DNA-binding NtrC family response regulator